MKLLKNTYPRGTVILSFFPRFLLKWFSVKQSEIREKGKTDFKTSFGQKGAAARDYSG